MSFAKLFESERYGQVLAVVDRADDGNPEIRWSCEPPGLGKCDLAFSFTDDDEGWDLADAALASADIESAEKAATAIFKAAGVATKDETQ